MIKISVVIPAFNAQSTIKDLLVSLFNQTFPKKDFEIILVDDGSRDETVKIIKTTDKEKRVRLFSEQNKGAAQARNLGASKARGEILLFVDSDTVLPKDLVAKYWLAYQKHNNQIIGGGVKNPKGVNYLAWTDYLSSWHNAHEGMKKQTVKEYLPTVNLSLKRKVFNDIGGFWKDKSTGEDVDFGLRAGKKGYQFFFDPSLGLWHKAPSFNGFLKHNYNWGKHIGKVRGKYPELKFHWLLSQKGPLALLVFPVVVLGYLTLLLKEWFKFQLFTYIICLPLLFVGRFAYGLGFLKQALTKK